ncbi:odorant receptor 22c-like [Pogonomyrmex barbatus]|uniref:Odorant receptor 22c-like n=1 Tax=Pogonomyrmex barbatus TaxID=144034 RepID=A0A8N1S328_9HYME|nr:odorant receptor 22c-like [Pogonomyrmex barbatus]
MENEMKHTVCRSVEYGLRLIGVWPGTSFAILRKFLSILSVIVFQIFQYQHVIVHFGEEDLTVLMDALSVTVAYTILFIKMIIFSFNARLLNEIIASMSKDWKECDISNEYTMTRIAYVSRWVSNVIIFSHMMSVFLYATGQINERVLHICGQIDLMRQKLSEVTRKNIERKNVDQDVNESIVKALIIRHQQIIIFSKNIENLYSNIALIQFFSNTLVICCLGFLIVISIGVPGGSMMLIKSVFFYIVMSLEAFIYCFVGEHLSTKSEMIGDSAYESLWYESSPSQNRDIHIMIIRSQKHLTLTIGKVAELSLRQFANIIKASASYVSVLHAMY